ncbi:G2/M phase-specific E3 ubiquitin-protein ligase [Anabarilius grahami]|uniref:G2/M phase-specific E3 ubiquitin-protein ligase n=1 Tax=Anabarilius grahami TaxID=495550 RepID=A0A3N0Z313_ANAGA|nr:G2/M phase-specific E3 ubiquitin-protein ligase [Anabarilius grahami]
MHYTVKLFSLSVVVLLAYIGGNGRRRISVIPLEAEGYTGSVIKSASSGGKNLLYVVPLQDELDMTPLPPDAPEFARMPKATCKKCKTLMPLQTLALHVDQCDSMQNSVNSEIEEEDLVFIEEATSSNVIHHLQEAFETRCPICLGTFPVSDLELHASFCGESEEDVIRHAAAQINTTKTFEICVSRDNMVERGLKLWKRQKMGSPVNPLKIIFLGEPGVDTGALRKEFLSTMVAGIEKRLFEGDAKKGKTQKYSLNDLDNELFKVAGEIFAVSIAQGGPPPRFMQEWCYEYLVTGNIKRDGVHDTEISPIIKMIEDASDLSNFTKEILDCGYTGPINTDHKESILRGVSRAFSVGGPCWGTASKGGGHQ